MLHYPTISCQKNHQQHALRRSRHGFIEHVLWTLLWFAIFSMVFTALQLYLSRVSSSTRFERIKLANDFSLTATAAPIPSTNYEMLLPPYSYYTDYDNGMVRVKAYEPNRQAAIEEHAPYAMHSLISLQTPELAPGTYRLAKNGNQLSITPKEGIGISPLNRLTCPGFIPPQHIVIDPGHGGTAGFGDPGALPSESDLTTLISTELATQLTSKGYSATRTRPDNTPLAFPVRIQRIQPNAMLISIHAHPSIIAGKATVTAYILADAPRQSTSSALACTAVNALLSDPALRFTGGNIVVQDRSTLGSHEDLRVLEHAGVGVVLMLNGLDLAKESTPFAQPSLFGKDLAGIFIQSDGRGGNT